MSSSCSFRITRSAEDLAKTLSILSQRLVSLENRLEVLELSHKDKVDETPAEQQLEMLDSVDKLMQECKEILNPTTHYEEIDESWENEKINDEYAA